ncbi:MAG: thermonuclease family protein [Gammaproteobacteria bacterium]
MRIIIMFLFGMTATATYASGVYIVESIEDGDTVVVRAVGKKDSIRIQLTGIDAPEDSNNAKLKVDIKKTGLDPEKLLIIGRAATDHIKAVISPGMTVRLEADFDQLDRYGRVPAIIFGPGKSTVSVNEQMIIDGYARYLTSDNLDVAFSKQLEQLQQKAIEKNRGLWGRDSQVTRLWSGLQ